MSFRTNKGPMGLQLTSCPLHFVISLFHRHRCSCTPIIIITVMSPSKHNDNQGNANSNNDDGQGHIPDLRDIFDAIMARPPLPLLRSDTSRLSQEEQNRLVMESINMAMRIINEDVVPPRENSDKDDFSRFGSSKRQ